LLLALTPAAHGAPQALIELKGVVTKPVAPFDPAPDCTVTVFDSTFNVTLAHDITNDRGQFRFKVPKGQQLIVIAHGRAEESMPGTLAFSATKNPTEIKVQLQPPESAEEEAWFRAGVLSAKSGEQTASLTANVLYARNIPAASMFQFVKGVTSESKHSFQDIDNSAIFKSENSKEVVSGLKEVQSEWTYTGTVPSYSALSAKTDGKLTPTEYVEILGFAAPANSAAKTKWEGAVQRSVGEDGEKEVLNAAEKFDRSVFKSGPLVYTNAPTKESTD
jgi:hypothetical protein